MTKEKTVRPRVPVYLITRIRKAFPHKTAGINSNEGIVKFAIEQALIRAQEQEFINEVVVSGGEKDYE